MEEQNLEEPPAKVKHEPPVEFVLILPRPKVGWKTIKQEEKVKPKRWVKAVEVKKFDVKWRAKMKLNQSALTCPHCRIILKYQHDLTKHLKACAKLNPARFECDFCGKKIQKKCLMRPHMVNHMREKKFFCSKCGIGFKREWNLLSHYKTKTIIRCVTCDFKFSCKLLLDRHQSEFHGNVFKCDQCPRQFENENLLLKHQRTHDKSLTCPTCRSNLSCKKQLKIHQMKYRHGIYATGETFDCDKCDKTYSTQNFLRKHQQHHVIDEVRCEVCNKIFKNRSYLRDHNRIHEAKVECSICNKMMARCDLTRHFQIHSAKSLFKCDSCNYTGKSRNHIKDHIERMHLLRKLVIASKCHDFCDFTLLEKLQHKYGSLTTDAEAKFQCDECECCTQESSFALRVRSMRSQNWSQDQPSETYQDQTSRRCFDLSPRMRRHVFEHSSAIGSPENSHWEHEI